MPGFRQVEMSLFCCSVTARVPRAPDTDRPEFAGSGKGHLGPFPALSNTRSGRSVVAKAVAVDELHGQTGGLRLSLAALDDAFLESFEGRQCGNRRRLVFLKVQKDMNELVAVPEQRVCDAPGRGVAELSEHGAGEAFVLGGAIGLGG